MIETLAVERTKVRVKTMKAAVLFEPGRMEVVEVELPEPGIGEVRFRVEGCGVCVSNIPPWEGRDWFSYPMEPGALGHEAWGWIDAVGPGVDEQWIGRRVAALSWKGYAEYDIAKSSHVVLLPPAIDDRPFPGEPLGCAFNVFRRSQIEPGQTVAIIGIGFLGTILTQLATEAEAHVLAISRRQQSLEMARAFGAQALIPLGSQEEVIDAIRDGNDGHLCDVVIEATGKAFPLEIAGEATAERGRLVVAGYHQDGRRMINMQLWNWRGIDVINAHERDSNTAVEGIRMAVAAAANDRIDPVKLCTHRLDLEDLGSALELTRDRPDGFIKAWVEP